MQTSAKTSPQMLGFVSICLLLMSTLSFAVPPAISQPSNVVAQASTSAKAAAPATQATDAKTPAKPALPTAQQFQQQIKQLSTRVHQLEEANQEALARNQELQLANDNLAVQVQVLQSERSAQMFLYGAATLAVGAIIGFILCNSILSKRSRRW